MEALLRLVIIVFGIHSIITAKAAEDPVQCPCDYGLDWADTESISLDIDVHRPTSCIAKNSQIKINWAKIDRTGQIYNPFRPPLDGVTYNYVFVDSENSRCGWEDMVMLISPEETLACKEQIENACERVESSVCPCYSFSDLAVTEEKISEGEIILDRTNSCIEPNDEEDKFGLFEVESSTSGANAAWEYTNQQTHESSSSLMHTTQDQCFAFGDITQSLELAQVKHCTNLMQKSCRALIPQLAERELQCADDLEYKFKDRNIKTCKDWVALNTEERCRLLDPRTETHVFEHCRYTCSMCTCEDDSNFRWLDDQNKDCNWVKKRITKRCNKGDIADHCISTCSSECCKDNPAFEMWGKTGCGWVDNYGSTSVNSIYKRKQRCKRQRIARNCPETCGKCPSINRRF